MCGSILIRSVPLALALALAMPVIGCATTQSTGEEFDDFAITRKVGMQLTANPEIRRYKIDVDTLNGVVTLRGDVNSMEDKQLAARIARNTSGVRAVRNQLEVEPAALDSWIVTKIASKLTMDPDVKKRNIDVDSRDGVVTLSGIVESEQAKREAEAIARDTEGVRKVVNELQVGQAGQAPPEPTRPMQQRGAEEQETEHEHPETYEPEP